jgi:TonB family protein
MRGLRTTSWGVHRISPLVFCLGLLLAAAASGRGAELRTVGPRVIDEPVWVFPPAADYAGLRQGGAQAVLSLSRMGELLDFLVVGCSHPAFAQAVAEALPDYKFTPAIVRGEPRPVRLLVKFDFQKGGTVGSIQFDDIAKNLNGPRATNATAQSLVCPPGALDRPLAPMRVAEPNYPDELRHEGPVGEVKVDFYVDGTGRVRLPAVDPTAHPSFAREALSALLEWRFEPPTRDGRPALVKVEQVFNFPAPKREAGVESPRG